MPRANTSNRPSTCRNAAELLGLPNGGEGRDVFDIDDGIQAELLASIVVSAGDIFLEVEGRRIFRLSPLADQRLALVGWTMERYFQYECIEGKVTSLALILRRGRGETRIQFPLHR